MESSASSLSDEESSLVVDECRCDDDDADVAASVESSYRADFFEFDVMLLMFVFVFRADEDEFDASCECECECMFVFVFVCVCVGVWCRFFIMIIQLTHTSTLF